jgi:hypothetical protein
LSPPRTFPWLFVPTRTPTVTYSLNLEIVCIIM